MEMLCRRVSVTNAAKLLLLLCHVCLVCCKQPGLSADLFGALGKLSDALGMGDKCEFHCLAGKEAHPNPAHKPKSNGCGSYGIQIDTSAFPQITKCCDSHDICYDTCGEKREKCDKSFKKCLLNTCQTLYDEGKLKRTEYEGCQTTSNMIFMGASTLGCQAYMDAQENACMCIRSSEL